MTGFVAPGRVVGCLPRAAELGNRPVEPLGFVVADELGRETATSSGSLGRGLQFGDEATDLDFAVETPYWWDDHYGCPIENAEAPRCRFELVGHSTPVTTGRCSSAPCHQSGGCGSRFNEDALRTSMPRCCDVAALRAEVDWRRCRQRRKAAPVCLKRPRQHECRTGPGSKPLLTQGQDARPRLGRRHGVLPVGRM